MNASKTYDVVIIGAGAAGIFASTMAQFFQLSSLLLEQKSYYGGQPMELYPNKDVYDFPTYPAIRSNVVVDLLWKQNAHMFANNANHYVLNTKLLSITPVEKTTEFGIDTHYAITTDHSELLTNHIIIATGQGSFLPITLEVNNQTVAAHNIHYMVQSDNRIYQNKRIVVLGGGDAAVEWANYFVEQKLTKDVSIVHRRDKYRCTSQMVNVLKANKIKEYLNYQINDVDLTDQTLSITHNVTKATEQLAYDFVLVQYGQKPQKETIPFFSALKKVKNKCVVNQNQKTNLTNVYAIGDAIHYEHRPNTMLNACAEAMSAIWHISKKDPEEAW